MSSQVSWVLDWIHEQLRHTLGKVKEILVCLFLFFPFRATPAAYGSFHRLGVAGELQLPAYTTVTATWDPSWICDLHCSL